MPKLKPANHVTLSMSREEAEDLVSQERVHQDILLGARSKQTPYTLFGSLALLDDYAGKAIDDWCQQAQVVADGIAMDQVRKIAAIGVRYLESFGGLDRAGLSRAEVFRQVRTQHGVAYDLVQDLAAALIRLRVQIRQAQEAAVGDDRPSYEAVGGIFGIIGSAITAMEVHGAPERLHVT